MRHLHVLAIGQSNLANHGAEAHQSAHGRCFDTGFDVRPLSDPIPGGTGKSGSIWPLVADRLRREAPEMEFGLTLRAQGGTSVEDWSPGGACHEILMETLLGRGTSVPLPTHVVWHQGERDTMLGTSSDEYRARFLLLHRAVQAFLSVPWIICRASYRKGVTSDVVISAQERLIAEMPDAVAGPNTDLLGSTFRHDDTHLNHQGQAAFARNLAEVLLRVS